MKEASEPAQAASLENKLTHLQNQLAYINNYPMHWKYISLFPTADEDKKTS